MSENFAWPHLKIQTCIFYLSAGCWQLSQRASLPGLVIYTLTCNDGVSILAEIFISNIMSLIQKKTKDYNYMVCIPRKLDIFKHKKQKLA